MIDQFMINMRDVTDAQKILRNVAKETPIEHSRTFSEMSGNDVYLKLENLQTTGSFKLRGAYNKIYHATEEERRKGIVATSAGNHSQGVAYAANLLNVKATIFMPIFTAPSKIIATKNYGAEIKLYGETYDECNKKAIEYSEKNNKIFVHPFNDPYVIAGQATIGLEIFDQIRDIDAVVVPIGGGGLISGIAFVLKSINNKIRIIGVEAEGASSMKFSVEKGQIEPLVKLDTIADSIAVKIPGPLTLDMVKLYVDDLVTVKDEEIANAMYLLLTRNKLVTEPAGASALAAILAGKVKMKNKKICAVISGGNVDFNLLTQITQKGLLNEKLMVKISVTIPDKPGSLKQILNFLSERQINVQDMSIDRIESDVPAGMAKINIVVQTIDAENIKEIVNFLKAQNIVHRISE
jgi:threonine dehydratase